MSNGMVIDLFMELFDVCRNACIPKAKFEEALISLNTKKNNSGTLIFEYKGSDQLDRLISVIKDNY